MARSHLETDPWEAAYTFYVQVRDGDPALLLPALRGHRGQNSLNVLGNYLYRCWICYIGAVVLWPESRQEEHVIGSGGVQAARKESLENTKAGQSKSYRPSFSVRLGSSWNNENPTGLVELISTQQPITYPYWATCQGTIAYP